MYDLLRAVLGIDVPRPVGQPGRLSGALGSRPCQARRQALLQHQPCMFIVPQGRERDKVGIAD